MLRDFLRTEAAGGMVLILAAALALIVANSPLSPVYFNMLDVHLGPLSMLHWINDGLMAIFFLLVGLEVKRELIEGELSTWQRRLLPGIAAAAGMAVPALIYVAINWRHPETRHGWAIPAATDIAFALGVLALLGKRVSASLKIFLTAVAIIDDLGAILIIALFYTGELAIAWLTGALISIGLLVVLNRRGVTNLWPYLTIGSGLWLCTLLSGVHPTLAGVAVALTIPLRATPARPDDTGSALHRLEHALHPWVAFAIVPLFGFTNAGVTFNTISASQALNSVPLGIACGLFIGKQIGVFGSIWIMVRWRLVDPPAVWRQAYGVAILCGIGFTMSLFIGGLAFEASPHAETVKIGVLAGSILSAITGWAVLRTAEPDGIR